MAGGNGDISPNPRKLTTGAIIKARTRAEVRGTTVYASDTLLLGDIEGISASTTSKMFGKETLQVFPLTGVHMAETHMLCPWPLC